MEIKACVELLYKVSDFISFLFDILAEKLIEIKTTLLLQFMHDTFQSYGYLCFTDTLGSHIV